ncbi:DASH complex subunit ask1 [Apophysomyces sp. BC1034]|nr:DASH complex subunit ask1 [Apophysomyces sp. BC1015]KAG0176740.1 DASH complex subunit ask1 [Apophysomyces sp. BC1021]KAG0194370.1 DASH complex subunit ask1 [Apophysomyces sp. BC1034]
MALTDEEADAEIERLQQNITLSLQAIDQNFARCHQIVSERFLPTVDRLAEASQRVWNFNRMWLHYFDAAGGSNPTPAKDEVYVEDGTTNRPPFSTPGSVLQRLRDPITSSSSVISLNSHGRLRSTRPPIPPRKSTIPQSISYQNDTSTTSSRASLGIGSVSVTEDDNSEVTQRDHRGFALSPPRTIPFAKTPAQLLRTPRREAAKMMAEDLLWSAGGRSPSSQSSGSDRRPSVKGKGKEKSSMEDAWTESNLDKEDEDGRAKFEKFAMKRKLQLQQMGEHEELPSIPPRNRSPMAQSPWIMDRVLPSTPTMQRVLTTYNQDLRTMKRQRTSQDEPDRDMDGNAMDGLDWEKDGRDAWSGHNADFQSFEYDRSQMDTGSGKEDGDHAAHEFSGPILPDNTLRTPSEGAHSMVRMSPGMHSGNMSVASTSTMTMVTGMTGQVPARFSLDYFASAFRTPPGSTQLTAVYCLFADRPGQMLTKDDVLGLLPDYGHETVSLLVDLLARKRFLKRVGTAGWTLRR